MCAAAQLTNAGRAASSVQLAAAFALEGAQAPPAGSTPEGAILVPPLLAHNLRLSLRPPTPGMPAGQQARGRTGTCLREARRCCAGSDDAQPAPSALSPAGSLAVQLHGPGAAGTPAQQGADWAQPAGQLHGIPVARSVAFQAIRTPAVSLHHEPGRQDRPAAQAAGEPPHQRTQQGSASEEVQRRQPLPHAASDSLVSALQALLQGSVHTAVPGNTVAVTHAPHSWPAAGGLAHCRSPASQHVQLQVTSYLQVAEVHPAGTGPLALDASSTSVTLQVRAL